MHKHAALTALAMALITMLTLDVSATQVSAAWSDDRCYGRNCHCSYQCYGKPGTLYLAKLRRCKPGAHCDTLVIPPDIHACLATCMAEKASRR
jgi:hypothetical protein